MKSEDKKWASLAISRTDLPSIYEFATRPLEAGLWCLLVSKEEFNIDYLSYEELEHILREYLHLPLSTQRLKKAFARAGDRIIKKKDGDSYKISKTPGEEYLRSLKKNQPLTILYVEPDKPRTASKNLESLVNSLPKDSLCIADPYYGLKTLDVLETFIKRHKEIKFMTTKVGGGENPTRINKAIAEFKKEFKNKVELRITVSSNLHDRYIIAKDIFLIVGHGIKDLGSKESLIVAVEDRFGKDIRKVLKKEFEDRWVNAKPL